jgi:hypothetical protein
MLKSSPGWTKSRQSQRLGCGIFLEFSCRYRGLEGFDGFGTGMNGKIDRNQQEVRGDFAVRKPVNAIRARP